MGRARQGDDDRADRVYLANKPYTAAELLAALNGLTLPIETAAGVTLANLHTATPAVDRIVKASL